MPRRQDRELLGSRPVRWGIALAAVLLGASVASFGNRPSPSRNPAKPVTEVPPSPVPTGRATLYTISVAGNGAMLPPPGAVQAGRVTLGHYRVLLPVEATRCASSVSLGAPTDFTKPLPQGVQMTPTPGLPRAFEVLITDAQGHPVDSAFTVSSSCS